MKMKDASAMTEASGLTGDEVDNVQADWAARHAEGWQAGRHALADDLRRLVIGAPLPSLAIAFLLGVFAARRR
jgi:hypothetical protein